MSNVYQKQDRGTAEGYAAYFAGMNKSMQQKVALTTAHFPPEGTLADMGSGSGQATFDLANLYDGLSLVGVDINPVAVEESRRAYQRHNLRYQQGDIADRLFESNTLDGILDSSVLHHVTSFNGFSLRRVEELLDHQVDALRPGGVLIIRDFVVPRGPATVDLEVRANDGVADGDEIPALCTAALLVRFARDFRSSCNPDGPVPFEELPPRHPGHRRFRLSLRAATEFVLRKDYRDHWAVELQEEYTYFTQAQFESAYRARNLRVVTSVDLHNPWIVENRFRGHFHLTDTEGRPLPFPPTNGLWVGEKVRPGEGVLLRERSSRVLEKPAFLQLEYHRHASTGRTWELVNRPNRTLDVLPWFLDGDRLFVLAKHGFPRPLFNVQHGGADLVGQHGAGYITEPIAAIVEAARDPAEEARRILRERAHVPAEAVMEVSPAWRYFTSPGGLNERVDAFLARIQPARKPVDVDNYSAFSTSGTVRHLDATQVLRACHVGGMFDARLELNIYRLCLSLGRGVGPWIGGEPGLKDNATVPAAMPAAEVVRVPARRVFEKQEGGTPAFLEVREGLFEEVDGAGQVLKEARFEYVLPRTVSHNTVTMLPVMKHGGGYLVGLETRDLPAVQAWEESSAILTVPACRLPRSVLNLDEAQEHGLRVFEKQYGLFSRRAWALGGRYHPSVGATPEVVYPFLLDVESISAGKPLLSWVQLEDVLSQVEHLRDGHLLCSLFRAAHALGVLKQA